MRLTLVVDLGRLPQPGLMMRILIAPFFAPLESDCMLAHCLCSAACNLIRETAPEARNSERFGAFWVLNAMKLLVSTSISIGSEIVSYCLILLFAQMRVFPGSVLV